MSMISVFFVGYGVLAIGHILLQMIVGHFEYRRHRGARHVPHPTYRVTVIVPSYNEDPEVLLACIRSIEQQRYPHLEIIVVDDGSRNIDELQVGAYNQVDITRTRVMLSHANIGKRHAQKLGFDEATGDIIVTVDSDTILRSPLAIHRILRRFDDPQVGAVTGDVRVENKTDTMLTRLISYRYWSAFHQERAAQSYHHAMMCCSGPFSAYRADIIHDIKHRYTSQRFMGTTCTFGDDRHLTNLVLEHRWRTVFDPHAVAYTHVPQTLRTYLRQQLRWNKSFYREMLWTLRSIHKHHWYLIYDLLMQFILPFLLLIALAATIYQAVHGHPTVVWRYLATLIGIAVLRAGYGVVRTRDKGFLLFVIYGFMHVCLLIPVRLYALCTIATTRWGTR